MTDLLQQGLSILPTLLPRRTIVYKRGVNSVSLSATVGRTAVYREDTEGVRVRTETRDYLIKPADLILGGTQVEPQQGDLIEDTNEPGSLTRTYQVMPDAGEEAWRYTDRYHTMLRVHVKEIDAV